MHSSGSGSRSRSRSRSKSRSSSSSCCCCCCSSVVTVVFVIFLLLLLSLLWAARASAAARGGAISGLACAETRVLTRSSRGIEFAFCFRIGFSDVGRRTCFLVVEFQGAYYIRKYCYCLFSALDNSPTKEALSKKMKKLCKMLYQPPPKPSAPSP